MSDTLDMSAIIGLLKSPGSKPVVIVRNTVTRAHERVLANWISYAARDEGLESTMTVLSGGTDPRTIPSVDEWTTPLMILHGLEPGMYTDRQWHAIDRLVRDAANKRDKRLVIVTECQRMLRSIEDRSVRLSVAMDKRMSAPLVHLMREISGGGMMDCKRAAEQAIERYDGDFVLALGVIHAHGLAVMVKSGYPKVSDAEARRRWDVAYARDIRANIVHRSEAGRALNAISGVYKGD